MEKKDLERMMDILAVGFQQPIDLPTRETARAKIKIYERYEIMQREYYLTYHTFYRDIMSVPNPEI
jgi:hypothetical protein